MKSDVMAATPKARKMPKKIDHIEIHEADNGGHILRHIHTNYDHPPEEHVFSPDQGHALVQHLMKHSNIALDTEAAAGTEENVDAKEKAQL